MEAEREKSKRLRVFVALDLPDDVRAGIAAWGRGSLADPALRAVAEESLHITLAFLGSRDPEEVESIAEVVRACGAPAPEIVLGQPQQRPLRGRAKVYALPVASEGTKALQAGLVSRLVEANLYEAEERPFWPHVTVARVRSERGKKRRPMAVERPPETVPQELLQAFRAVRLSFYISELQPEGARYVPLAQVELPR
ncbi:MAG TPA: RNA 2',3'-cyclic phosphodiesterase [Solirubrobacterales bacterium]|nr:RNA 2',3'-cyclic phosphodiesterase [Solirubrobacterales bacterium]